MKLTLLRLCADKGTGVSFFHIVGTDSFFTILRVPLMWTARVKQSFVKCTEQTPNMPCGLKSFRCKDTNLFHFSRVPPLVGELWIEIPKSKFVSLLQSWTAHRQGGIFGFKNNPNPKPVPSTQAYESSHVVFLECMMSLPVQGNSNQTSRPVFELSNGSKPKTKFIV